jgi:hypothetical protein
LQINQSGRQYTSRSIDYSIGSIFMGRGSLPDTTHAHEAAIKFIGKCQSSPPCSVTNKIAHREERENPTQLSTMTQKRSYIGTSRPPSTSTAAHIEKSGLGVDDSAIRNPQILANQHTITAYFGIHKTRDTAT